MERTGLKATTPSLQATTDLPEEYAGLAALDDSVARPVLPVTIRPMQLADIEQVARIERLSCAIPWTTQAYITEIGNAAAFYVVAASGETDDGMERVIGYGGIWTVIDESHVTTIAVHPDFRGRKVGEQILLSLIDGAAQFGARCMTLEVRIGNDSARNLYEKYGFIWAAIRKRYYQDNQEDAIIMWIHDMTKPEWREQIDRNRLALHKFRESPTHLTAI